MIRSERTPRSVPRFRKAGEPFADRNPSTSCRCAGPRRRSAPGSPPQPEVALSDRRGPTYAQRIEVSAARVGLPVLEHDVHRMKQLDGDLEGGQPVIRRASWVVAAVD